MASLSRSGLEEKLVSSPLIQIQSPTIPLKMTKSIKRALDEPARHDKVLVQRILSR